MWIQQYLDSMLRLNMSGLVRGGRVEKYRV